jgi:hypothetical protein
MKFFFILLLFTFLFVEGKAQTSKTPDENRAARRLIHPNKADEFDRLEAEATREFKAVNAFADRFYERWGKTLDLVELDQEFLTRESRFRTDWGDWRSDFDAPESFKLPPDLEFRLSLELLSFKAIGETIEQQNEDEIPPDLERRFDALEEAHAGVFSGTGNPDPEVFLLQVSRFIQDVRETARPFIRPTAGQTTDPEIRFFDPPVGVVFLVERGPFTLFIQKEAGEYRILQIEVED